LQDAKSSLQMQILLKLEQIDLQVQLELATDQVLGTLKTDSSLNLVDDLLWTFKNELLKY